MATDFEIVSFESAAEWREWLDKNHATADGVWIKMFKKATGIKSITHQEAIIESLCYGWIDGQSKALDDKAWLQKFTPRRKRSIWSKINIGHVERLIKEGKMMPAGIKEYEAAGADGRLQQAYDSPSTMVIPEDFLKELSKNKQALEFFEKLSKTNKFAVGFQLQTAKKPETRARRMEKILARLYADAQNQT